MSEPYLRTPLISKEKLIKKLTSHWVSRAISYYLTHKIFNPSTGEYDDFVASILDLRPDLDDESKELEELINDITYGMTRESVEFDDQAKYIKAAVKRKIGKVFCRRRRHYGANRKSPFYLSPTLNSWFRDSYTLSIEDGYYGLDFSNVAQAIMEAGDDVILRVVQELLPATMFEFKWPKSGGSMLELLTESIATIVMASPEFRHLVVRVEEGDIYGDRY